MGYHERQSQVFDVVIFVGLALCSLCRSVSGPKLGKSTTNDMHIYLYNTKY